MTTTEDLYQQANETYVEYTRRAALASLERAGLRAVVDLALAARDEMTDAEVLRKAAEIYAIRHSELRTAVELLADRLEAEHLAEQEAAAAEAEREKLIEQARGVASEVADDDWTDDDLARAFVDAGWRPAPESDGGEQA